MHSKGNTPSTLACPNLLPLLLRSPHFQYELNRGNKQFQKFLVAQIRLLKTLCKGNNTAVLDVLKRAPNTRTFGVEIDLTLIMAAINDQKIKLTYPKLRAAFVELLKGEYSYFSNPQKRQQSDPCFAVMYVEVGENRPFLEKFPFSFVSLWDYIMYYDKTSL